MRLLLDQNLSFRLCRVLADVFPESMHVRLVGLAESEDSMIWEYAKANGYAVVTQDADFADMAVLFGPPPKVIWIRVGNQSRTQVAALLRRHVKMIEAFDQDDAVCLEIY